MRNRFAICPAANNERRFGTFQRFDGVVLQEARQGFEEACDLCEDIDIRGAAVWVWDVPACRAVSGHVGLQELWGCSMSLHAAEVNARIARHGRDSTTEDKSDVGGFGSLIVAQCILASKELVTGIAG